jgi:hypothetical protein
MVTWILRLCAITLALTMLFAAWNGVVENREFRAYGERATAEPIAQYTETTTTTKKFGIEVDQSKSKSAELTFTTRDGRKVTVQKVLSDGVFDQFRAHAPVVIEYLPNSPTTTRFAGESSSPITASLLGLLFLVGTYIFWNRLKVA